MLRNEMETTVIPKGKYRLTITNAESLGPGGCRISHLLSLEDTNLVSNHLILKLKYPLNQYKWLTKKTSAMLMKYR